MRKKQLLATLVMLSLMQGSVYADAGVHPSKFEGQAIIVNNEHAAGNSGSNQDAGLISMWNASTPADVTVSSITITNSSLDFNNFTQLGALYLEGANKLVVSGTGENDGNVTINNFSGSSTYGNIAGISIYGGGIYKPSTPPGESPEQPVEPEEPRVTPIIAKNFYVSEISDTSIRSNGNTSGIQFINGGTIEAEQSVEVSKITGSQNAFGINLERGEGDSKKATFVSNTTSVDDVHGALNASGIRLAGAEWNTNTNVLIKKIQADNGNAAGLLTESTDYGDSVTVIDGILDISNVKGSQISYGVSAQSGTLKAKHLQVSDIGTVQQNRMLVNAKDNAVLNFETAILTPEELNDDTEFKYQGNFEEDASTDAFKISSIAVRSVLGADVKFTSNNNSSVRKVVGDIVAGRGSEDDTDVAGKISFENGVNQIYGDVYAGNGGEITISLGQGSFLEGQVDDYHELANGTAADTIFRNSAFTDDEGNEIDVTSAGKATLNINDGGKWIARGQSFVDTISLDGGIIDMSKNENSSVTVENLKGEGGRFIMRLDTGNHENSDMLYVTGNFEGNHELIINSDEFVASEITEDNPLRFATIKGDVNVENMKARVTDAGFFNNTYNITKESFDKKHEENEDYNGSGNGQGSYKPGNDVVTSTFDENDVNLLITAEGKQSQISDAGQTIINMSRANYSNAIYMDRLNKRMGEARYINPEDEQGMWVRLRHDRIGKEDAFRSQNTMYEMGYDVKQDSDNGDRRVGFAIDYMDGKTEYRNVAGDGDIKRYGLWLYDTWMGDKGHYADYVLKWGHLENDFDIYNSRGKVNGDYSNNVFSVSAEYGKKNDMGNDWYFEPQAQLQLARVTSADYVTSQNTKVSLDGINSLIGRAGFRLGKDMGERSTVYVKADVLHEFLGDQTISALDTTTNGTYRETFENKGTWYDVGFGFATALGKDSYAFMDFEKSFGNDNDETYQINAGVQWTF